MNPINENNIKPITALICLLILELYALYLGINGTQFGVVIGIIGAYLAIKKD
jgi:uncharacterized membrane protein